MSSEIPILSFFTGAGFLDLGFQQRGFKGLWHNEYYTPFKKGFEHSFRGMGIKGSSSKIQNSNSIVDIGPHEIIKEAFGTKAAPNMFGVIGGPPCPDFSVGGKNRGQMGVQGRLSEVYVNRIIELDPAFFVFENVPGLLRTSKHRDFLVNLLDKLAIRYALDLRVLNALDFGVPQDRERIFIVGFRKKWLKKNIAKSVFERVQKSSLYIPTLSKTKPKQFFAEMEHWFPWPEIPEYKGAKHRFDWPFDPVPKGKQPCKPDCPKELMVGTWICDKRRFNLPNSSEGFTPKSSKFNDILEGDVSRKSFKRLHRFRYSPAAAYGNNEVHLHPTLPRRITVREAMMIQTVPDNYELPPDMTLSAKFKTIGNGVPVKLADAIAGAVAYFMKEECHEKI
jgi:DNA (cytosine-5)-methyltransferase 1